jgi:PAS domain S-box-containing protein
MAEKSMTFDPRAIAEEQPNGKKSEYQYSEEIFRLLVSSVKDYAIFILDTEGRVMSWNEGAETIKGYQADEIIGQHFSKFYQLEDRERNHPEYELQQAREKGRYEEEGWRVRKDGTLFWANVVITALRGADGMLLGYSKVTRDLTERKVAEQLLEENLRLIAASNDELQRLSYVVSHELQAPIYTISRYCNLLSARYKDRLGSDANEFIEKISNSSALIARMVDDIWIYARIAKPNFEREVVFTGRVLEDALSEVRSDLADAEVLVGGLPSVGGNRSQLVYLFKELLRNSIKYKSDERLRIQISAKEEHGGYLFSFEDNGIGIDSVYSTDVFKLFHRLNGGQDAESTGMGLAICKKILEQHGGKIWCEPQEKGAKFAFWIPDR